MRQVGRAHGSREGVLAQSPGRLRAPRVSFICIRFVHFVYFTWVEKVAERVVFRVEVLIAGKNALMNLRELKKTSE